MPFLISSFFLKVNLYTKWVIMAHEQNDNVKHSGKNMWNMFED